MAFFGKAVVLVALLSVSSASTSDVTSSRAGQYGLVVNVTRSVSSSWVSVSWSGVSDVDLRLPTAAEVASHAEDQCAIFSMTCTTFFSSAWVGLFSPPVGPEDVVPIKPITGTGTAPWTKTAPVKFFQLSQPEGSRDVYLNNLRDDVQFMLFTGGSAAPELVATSDIVEMTDKEAPLAPHLALTGKANEMQVMWNHKYDAAQYIRWTDGRNAHPRLEQQATVSHYTAEDLCGAPANSQGWREPGYFHTAVLQGLRPGEKYSYQVGSDEYGWSDTYSFKAAVLPDAKTPLQVIVIADMGETYIDGLQYHWEEPDAVNTTVHAAKFVEDSDLVVHVGDLSYATGYESEWSLFMEQISKMAAHLPYMTGQGNHERDFPSSGDKWGGYDSGGECGIPTQTRFHMPVDTGYTQDDGWYSFEQGPVHFVMMNTEMSCDAGTRQIEWIEDDLASVDRDTTPWVVFMGHRQMYAAPKAAPSQICPDSLEPLLLKYKVDLVLWGHIHYALLSCPMYQGECVRETDETGYAAPIHAVIGNAGQSLSGFAGGVPDWADFHMNKHGFSVMNVESPNLLSMDFYSDTPLDSEPVLEYTLKITRTRSVD